MFIITMNSFNLKRRAAAAVELNAYEGSDLRREESTTSKPPFNCVCLSITCNREHSVEAAVPVRQMQPVAHLDLVSLGPGKVHQGATNVTPQLEHLLVDVEILAIATTCQGQHSQLQPQRRSRNDKI